MADSTLAAMTADTDPTTTSLLYLVEDPSGTPLNRKITAANLLVVTKNLTEDTAPDRAADFVATYDTSASGPKKVLLNNLGAYSLEFGMSNGSPADATTYFLGSWDGQGFQTTGGNRRVYIQRAGKITKADVFMVVASPGSNETSTMSVRVNNSTDTTISSSIEANSSTEHFSNNSMSVSVAVGDYVEIKWVTPTWVTNPTGVYIKVRLFVE